MKTFGLTLFTLLVLISLRINAFDTHSVQIDPNSEILYKVIFDKLCFEDGFAELTKRLDGGYIRVADDMLDIHYLVEYYPDGVGETLFYRIYNDQREVLMGYEEDGQHIDGSPEPPIIFGDNYLSINLSEFELSEGKYLLEVVTIKKEKLYLKFEIVQS